MELEFVALANYLENHLKLSKEDVALSLPYWKKFSYKKGEYFNQYGNVCQHLGFIVSGIFRTYYIDDNLKENTVFIYTPNEFVTAFRSMVQRIPCIYYVQALVPSYIVSIHINDLESLYSKSKGWERVGRAIAEDAFYKLLNRMENLVFLNAEDRYKQFLENFPDLPDLIPQYHIASFLGIENPSLSRIKNRLKTVGAKVANGDQEEN
ncbi:Cyclic nucleotide-binding domain protein [compost metagenome]